MATCAAGQRICLKSRTDLAKIGVPRRLAGNEIKWFTVRFGGVASMLLGNAAPPEAFIEGIGDAGRLKNVVHVKFDVATSTSYGEIRS